MDLTFLLVKAKSERIRLSRALLPFTLAETTSALPPPLTSKTSLSSQPLLPQLSLGAGNPLTSGKKKKKTGGKWYPPFPDFPPALRCPLCQGLAALADERCPPSARAGRRGSAWRISEEGEGRRPSGGAACRPSPRAPGSPPPFGPIASEAPPTSNPYPRGARQPRTYIRSLGRRGSRVKSVILLLGDASPLRIHGSRWFSCSG